MPICSAVASAQHGEDDQRERKDREQNQSAHETDPARRVGAAYHGDEVGKTAPALVITHEIVLLISPAPPRVPVSEGWHDALRWDHSTAALADFNLTYVCWGVIFGGPAHRLQSDPDFDRFISPITVAILQEIFTE